MFTSLCKVLYIEIYFLSVNVTTYCESILVTNENPSVSYPNKMVLKLLFVCVGPE